jgi:hypothetical protein
MALLVGLAWLAAGGAPAAAEKRIALVIANAAYPTAPLANPLRDAKRVSEALEAVGFTVEQATDLAQVDMRSALSLFAARLSGADTVALFYYAGHAVQLGGENYLLPVDSPFKTEADVRLSGIRLDQILYAMRPQKSRLSIAVLDACRDNPFPALSRSVGRGLAPVNAPGSSRPTPRRSPTHSRSRASTSRTCSRRRASASCVKPAATRSPGSIPRSSAGSSSARPATRRRPALKRIARRCPSPDRRGRSRQPRQSTRRACASSRATVSGET